MQREILLRGKGLTLKPFTQDAIIWGIASHEVRHRIQWHSSITLFYDIVYVKNAPIKEIQDQDLKDAIDFTINLYEKLMLEDNEFIKRVGLNKLKNEFDADVIENYVARKWKTTSIKNIAQIIKTDAKKLIRGKSTSFLLLIWISHWSGTTYLCRRFEQLRYVNFRGLVARLQPLLTHDTLNTSEDIHSWLLPEESYLQRKG